MKKYYITSLAILSNPDKRLFNVLFSRAVMLSIIHKNQHIAFLEAVYVNQEFFDIFDIIVTASQCSLLTSIVYPNQDCSFCPSMGWRDNLHGFINIYQSGAVERKRKQ